MIFIFNILPELLSLLDVVQYLAGPSYSCSCSIPFFLGSLILMSFYVSLFHPLCLTGQAAVFTCLLILVTNFELKSDLWQLGLEQKLFTTYRVIQEESARLREMIVCVILSKKVHINVFDFGRLWSYDHFLIPVHALVWTTSHSWWGHVLR